jgi:outer membrane protein assembly factor BamB
MTDIENTQIPVGSVKPAVNVLAVGYAGQVHLLDLETGATHWSFELALEKGASACDGQPVTVRICDEIVLAASMGHIFALRIDDGTVLWRSEKQSRGAGAMSVAFGAVTSSPVGKVGQLARS